MYDKKNEHDRMSKRILRNRFSVKYERSNETLGKIEEDFLMYPTRAYL